MGPPIHPGCIMIYSYHQICPALNSKPYLSNKQVVPLLGCCSDAQGSPGNLVICGIKPSSNSILGLKIEKSNPKSDWKKLPHFFNTLWSKIRPLNASFLSGLGMYSASLPSHRESANLFSFQKSLNTGHSHYVDFAYLDTTTYVEVIFHSQHFFSIFLCIGYLEVIFMP